MPSVLNTVIKFQNDILKNYKKSDTLSTECLYDIVESGSSDKFLTLSKKNLVEIINRNSWINPEFNCEREIIYNFDMIENELQNIVLSNKSLLSFDVLKKGIKFAYFNDYGRLSKTIDLNSSVENSYLTQQLLGLPLEKCK